MKVKFRTALLAAVVLGSAAPTAQASADVSAVAADGRVLSVGSVVAQGVREGDVCKFADDVVTLSVADGAGAISLRSDENCRLIVDFLGVPSASMGTNANVALESRRPKLVDESAGASASGGAGGVIGHVGITGTPVDDAVALANEVAAAASATEQKLVKLSQTIYSGGGIRQYEDSVDVQYLRDKRTGAMSAVEAYDGYCIGDLVSDLVYTPVTEIRNCFYKTLYGGPDRVGFVSGGYYRQVVAGIQTDGRKLTETFNAYRNQTPTRSCSTGGSLPLGWYNYCFMDVN